MFAGQVEHDEVFRALKKKKLTVKFPKAEWCCRLADFYEGLSTSAEDKWWLQHIMCHSAHLNTFIRLHKENLWA